MLKSAKPTKLKLIDNTETNPIDHAAILDFADLMENLAELKELDIVPKSFIDYIKEDKNKISTLVEYSAALVAVMEGTLLVCFESIEKFYKPCQKILMKFREKGSPSIPVAWLSELTAYKGSKSEILKKIAQAQSTDAFGVSDADTRKNLYSVDLSSKIMMCYNGEYGQSFTIRMDLMLLGQIKDFEKELNILCIVHKRFKKSSIAWHYRKVVFMCLFSQTIDKLKEKLSGGKAIVTADDFAPLKGIWERELDRIDPVIHKHGRSYKIWEYLVHIAVFIHESLVKLVHQDDPDIPAALKSNYRSEAEILLVQGFITWYDRVRELVKKNVHNHCTFGLLANIMKILLTLKIDSFMDNKAFYGQFLEEHLRWLGELRTYYKLLYGQPGQGNSIIEARESDRSKLESLEEHTAEVEHLRKPFTTKK